MEKIQTAQNTKIAGALLTQEASAVTAAVAAAVSKGEITLPNLPQGVSPENLSQSELLEAVQNVPSQDLQKAIGNKLISTKMFYFCTEIVMTIGG